MYVGLLFITFYFIVTPLACELGVWLYGKGGGRR